MHKNEKDASYPHVAARVKGKKVGSYKPETVLWAFK